MEKYIRYISSFIVLVIISVMPAAAAAEQDSQPQPSLMISEVQTGGLAADGGEAGRLEFIELYNALDIPLQMTGWRLDYLSAMHDGSGAAARTLVELQGAVQPHDFIVVSTAGYMPQADLPFTATTTSSSGLLARSGGHIRLLDGNGAVADLVGWGTATRIANWWHSPEIPAGMSIQRQLPPPGTHQADSLFDPPNLQTTPKAGPPLPPPNAPLPEEPAEPPASSCSGVTLSEILPNAGGTDAGKEFIEIFNPTPIPITLFGCSLQLGSMIPGFALPDEQLLPGAYRAFYDSETGITLPNTTAQTVRLITSTGEQSVTYANNMADDQSWAIINDLWQTTALPTPNGANQLAISASTAKRPTAASSTASAACGPRKERNAQTNRCRNIVTTTATATPCRPDQIRNPETNRCKAVAVAAAAQKACAPGQERNSQTNRCRKAATAGTGRLASVKDVPSASFAHDYRWWIAGLAAAAALSYALYEWRHDIAQKLTKWNIRRPSSCMRQRLARRDSHDPTPDT